MNNITRLMTVMLAGLGLLAAVPLVAGSSVERFVEQRYVHGVPYAQAKAYGPNAVPVLLRMLKNRRYSASWSNIVVTLGFIGDDRAVEPLISFIRSSGSKTVSDQDIVARRRALMALGYIVHSTGNKKALDYLTKSLDVKTWAGRKLQWRGKYLTPKLRDRNFTKMAVLGLAVSGKKEAGEILRKFSQSSAYRRNRSAYPKSMVKVINGALREHGKIMKKGLRSYYSKASPGPKTKPRRPARRRITR